jgi:cob(I)alamin adenosyltransferase
MTASLPAGIGAAKAGIGPVGAGHRALPVHRPAGSAVSHLRLVPQPEGMLQIHTAPFRGSFATVLSQALRTAGLGSRVLVSQFLKGGVDQGLAASPWLCGRLRWLRPAVPACLAEPAEQHRSEVREAVAEVWQHSREVLLGAAVDLLVLDELGLAMDLGYVGREEVLDVLERRPAQMDVILTGPAMGPELMAMADQVTQLRRGL